MYCRLRYDQIVTLHGGVGTRADRIRQHYESLGYSGTFYDMEMAWLADRSRTGTFGDRWRAETSAAGYSGTWYDRFKFWTWPVVAVLGAYWNSQYYAPAYFGDLYWAA